MTWDPAVLLDPYNLPYLLTLGAYVFHEMLALRLVLTGAHAGFLFLALTGGHPAGAVWNTLFVGINAWHVGRILWARRRLRFAPEAEALYRTVFASLTRAQFLEVWNQGEDRTGVTGVWLAEGDRASALGLVVEGTLVIAKGGRELNRLGPGRFVAEMGYLTRQPASASVTAPGPVRLRCWDYPVLERIERDQPDLWSLLQGVLGREMAAKIAEQNPR